MTTTTSSRPFATGGVYFAATIMVLAGLFQVFQGIIAIAKDPILASTPNYLFKFNISTWGWIHLIIGLFVALTGVFLYRREPWARAVALVLVGLQAFSNFFFMPYYPLWALTLVAFDLAVIWALVAAPGRGSDRGYDGADGEDTYQAAARAVRGA